MIINSLKLFILLSAFIFAVNIQSSAQISLTYNRDLNSYEQYDSKNYLTGDWGGFRARLNEMGITPFARYYISVLGNPAGGERKGVQYAGLLNAYLRFDLEKLFGIKSTKLIVSGSWASGKSLSNEDIGNLFAASQVFSGQRVSLYQLFLVRDFFDNKLNIAVGRKAVGDEFATSPIFYNYVNTSIDGNPISIPINDEGFLIIPTAGWAARARLKPLKSLEILAGVYNSNPNVGRDSAHGVDFSFRKGVILIGEVAYLRNQHSSSEGLQGTFKFGGFYDTRKFKKLENDTDKEKGNYGFYWLAEHMVYRETEKDNQGLTPWATFTVFPEESINTFPFFLSGGLVYKGLIPQRNFDKTAFGFAYGTLSEDLKDRDYEFMMELTYIIQATPWLKVQPDIQWIVHPGGRNEIPNAVVLGMQLGVDL